MTGPDIKALRMRLGMTQAQFASVLGLTRAHLAHVEAGARPVSDTVRILVRYVDRYGPLDGDG